MFFIILLFFSTFLYSSEHHNPKDPYSDIIARISIGLLDEKLAQRIHTKMYHNKKFNKDRSVQSEIQLLQIYQQHHNPLFDPQRLEELHQRAQAIELHLYMLKNSQCPQAQEFLTIACSNNDLTNKQKELFLELSQKDEKTKQEKELKQAPTVNTTPAVQYYQIILLILFFLATHQAIAAP